MDIFLLNNNHGLHQQKREILLISRLPTIIIFMAELLGVKWVMYSVEQY